jgi:O-antigen ligase
MQPRNVPSNGKRSAKSIIRSGIWICIPMLSLIAAILGLFIVVALPLAIKVFIFLLLALYLANVALMPKRPQASALALKRVLLSSLCVLVFWPTYAVFTTSGLPSIDPRKVSLLLLLLTVTYTCLNFESTLTAMRKTLAKGGWLTIFLAMFIVWRFGSVMASDNLERAFISFGWELLTFFLVFAATLIALRNPRDTQTALAVMTVCSAMVCLIAVIERFHGSNFISPLAPRNLEFDAVQALALQAKIREGANRVQATFEHPMALAEFLVLMAPVAAFVAFRHKNRLIRLCGLLTLPLIATSVFFTQTRSAIIALACMVVFGIILWMAKSLRSKTWGFRTYLSLIGIAIVIAVVASTAGVASSLVAGRTEAEQQSSLERLEQIKRAQSVIEKAPLLGAGVSLGNDTIGFNAFRGTLYVDNYYLTLALDSGIPGAVLFLLILLAAGFTGLRLFFSRSGEIAEMAGCFTLSIFGLVLTKAVLSIHYNLTYAYLLIGLLIVLKEQTHEQGSTVEQRGARLSEDLYRYS